MSKRAASFDVHGLASPVELRKLCIRIANQAGKGLWWNAMAAATGLVAVCQKGCREEVERVAKRRAREARTAKRRRR